MNRQFNESAAVEEPLLSREELLKSIQDLKNQDPEPLTAEEPDEESEVVEETAEDEGELAEAQDPDEGGEALEEALGKMSASDFAKEVGISLEELYRDVVLKLGDKEVSISQALDNLQALQTANAALTREREELTAKAQQAGVQTPAPGISPQAQALLAKAQTYQELAQNPETFRGMDDGQEAKARLTIQQSVQQLVGQAQMIEQQHQAAVHQHMARVRAESDRQMREKIPEWNDTAIREQEQRQIKDMAATYGFRAEEIDAIYDPRARRMMRDLLKATQTAQKVQTGARKLKKLSKTLPAGSRSTTAKKPSLKDLQAKLRDPSLTREQAQKIRLTMPLEE